MAKKEIDKNIYENLVESFIQARVKAGDSLLEMANTCHKAKEQLGNKKWLEWLKDSRIKLNKSQAMKFIAVAKTFNGAVQSTGFLHRRGIEESYLLTRIKDNSTREELAGQIIDADFTVKQTKEVINKVKKDNIPTEKAIELVKNKTKNTQSKSDRKTVSIEEYEKLKADYETLLKEKHELEKQLEELKKVKPCNCKDNNCLKKHSEQVNSKIQDNKVAKEIEKNNEITETKSDQFNIECLDKNGILLKPLITDKNEGSKHVFRRSIVCKGYELPLPADINLQEHNTEELQIIAVKYAKDEFNLDLS